MCTVSTCENYAQSEALFSSHCIVAHYGLLKCVKFLFHFYNSARSTNENFPYLLYGFCEKEKYVLQPEPNFGAKYTFTQMYHIEFQLGVKYKLTFQYIM
jgi:hypothetical protein